jgi:hypothetical protein
MGMLDAEELNPLRPGFNGEEMVACHVFNHEGVREIAKMPRAFWAYLYWLDEHRHLDANEFIRMTSKRFRNFPLDRVLWNSVAELSCHRWKLGMERPTWAGALVEMPEEWYEFCRKHANK